MIQINLFRKKKESHGHTEQTPVCQGGGVEGETKWEVGVSRWSYYMLRINKVLLYSTENYIQYPMANHMEKNITKNVYICMTGSLCYTAEINTTL